MKSINRILNIGVVSSNPEMLNRKIRVNNLISIVTIITMVGYIPAAIYFMEVEIMLLNTLFLISAFSSFYLVSKKHYNSAFYIASAYGLIYFSFGPIFYGLPSNLHFFIIIMCLIAIALFESSIALKIYIATSVLIFFTLIIQLKNKPGLINFTEEMKKAQDVISIVNLFILFFVTVLFFTFFRRENIIFQKAILKQKDIIEEKQKEI